MNYALPKKLWDRLGLVSILDTINRLSRNLNRRVRNRTHGGVRGAGVNPPLLDCLGFSKLLQNVCRTPASKRQ
jgi:hypothetical protein